MHKDIATQVFPFEPGDKDANSAQDGAGTFEQLEPEEAE